MNRGEIIARLASERDAFERLGVASLKLFGSAARNEAGPRSDADFIVRFKDPPTFDAYMDLKLYIEQVLGIRVDLVTESAIRPELRKAIERDAVRVA